jgi:hypothetical protein
MNVPSSNSADLLCTWRAEAGSRNETILTLAVMYVHWEREPLYIWVFVYIMCIDKHDCPHNRPDQYQGTSPWSKRRGGGSVNAPNTTPHPHLYTAVYSYSNLSNFGGLEFFLSTTKYYTISSAKSKPDVLYYVIYVTPALPYIYYIPWKTYTCVCVSLDIPVYMMNYKLSLIYHESV